MERLKELLVDDPEAAVRELRRSAHGCRWLLGRWYELDAILTRDGRWCGPERDEATRLLGHRPEIDRIVESETTFTTRLFNLLCHPDPSPVAIEWLCDPARRPESLQWTYRVDRLPGRAECMKALRDTIAGEVVELEELEEQLRTELDEPDLAEAATRALIPLDESKARLMLRYQTTAENSLYRAYNALKKARKEREAAGEDRRTGGAGRDGRGRRRGPARRGRAAAEQSEFARRRPRGPGRAAAEQSESRRRGPRPARFRTKRIPTPRPRPARFRTKRIRPGRTRPTGRPPGRRRRRRAMSRGGDRASTARVGHGRPPCRPGRWP